MFRAIKYILGIIAFILMFFLFIPFFLSLAIWFMFSFYSSSAVISEAYATMIFGTG